VTRFTGRGEFTYRTQVVVVDLRTGRERDLGRGACPSWAPHGEWIAYLRGRRLVVTRADRRRATVVTDDVASPATWAPSGRRLLFLRGLDDVVVAGVDGGPLRRIGVGVDGVAAWSPDGRRVVWAKFVATRPENRARDDLVVTAVDGGTTMRILRGAPNTRMESPVWTRRGRIVFAAGLLD
jgi:Tol biopolymer transport system component